MSTYYRGSGLTWEGYLQADSFVQDITDQLLIANQALSGIRNRLDAIHKTGKSSVLTQARELRQRL